MVHHDDATASLRPCEKASGEIMADLGISLGSQVLIWSPDSKWAAYGNRHYGSGKVKVYFWNGSSFEEATLPDDLPSPDIKFPKKTGSLKNYGGAATPLRWLKFGELELSSDSKMLDRIRERLTPASYDSHFSLTRSTTPG
jgi:hypothetical protein